MGKLSCDFFQGPKSIDSYDAGIRIGKGISPTGNKARKITKKNSSKF